MTASKCVYSNAYLWNWRYVARCQQRPKSRRFPWGSSI